ncbi:extensin [Methylobacterium sp. Leaf466]|nr:extensin [Methylobacterium sp. Leaf466]
MQSPSPVPPPRPEELGSSAASPNPVPTPATTPAPTPSPVPPSAPPPPERPSELTPAAPAPAVAAPPPAEMPAPPPRPADLGSETALAIKVEAVDDTACRRRLEGLGAVVSPLPPIALGQCGAARPLLVSSLKGVALNPPATLVCPAAEALARWTTEVQVFAERDLGAPLAILGIGTSYLCRGQNHDPDAKLSEHAFANGVDVMGYGFTGRPAIAVGPAAKGTPEAAFQASAQAKACAFFRTVLGPGSDAAHANHLHLDERERSAGHRLCQ